jgi:hypothetical protein
MTTKIEALQQYFESNHSVTREDAEAIGGPKVNALIWHLVNRLGMNIVPVKEKRIIKSYAYDPSTKAQIFPIENGGSKRKWKKEQQKKSVTAAVVNSEPVPNPIDT